jgi:hypothetical protein
MKNIQHPFGAVVAVLFFLFNSSANATCDLIEFKNQNFGGLELIRACSILPFQIFQPGAPDICEGLPVTEPQEPLLSLVTQDMLYFNWEIPVQNVSQLESALGLPERGFKIAPIELIRGESPKYYMSLNFYSTLIAGVINYRSEWSTYVVKEGDPKPRFMVFEVQSSEDAADPTYPGFIKPGTEVSYTLDSGVVQASNEDFHATFSLPDPAEADTAQVSKPWAEANDFLYWPNGVADTALYNGMLTDTPMVSINPDTAQIYNESVWSEFISDKPTHIVLFSKPLEFAFTPYFNLMDPSLGLDPAYIAALQIFKSFTFGAFSYGHAFQVLQGIEEPILGFDVLNDRVPSIFINFNIPKNKLSALESMLELPDGFKLAKSKLSPRQRARYLLTLNIYESPDSLTGERSNRAEWSIYVKDQNDPTADGRYLMVIDVDSSSASLNPVDLFTPPTAFEYKSENDQLEADIKYIDGQDKFFIEFDLPAANAPSVPLHEEWILSNDRVYWRNGVYDMLFYNGLLLDANMVEADPASVRLDDRTIWSQFVDKTPTQILVARNPFQFVLHPWYNVEELCIQQ